MHLVLSNVAACYWEIYPQQVIFNLLYCLGKGCCGTSIDLTWREPVYFPSYVLQVS